MASPSGRFCAVVALVKPYEYTLAEIAELHGMPQWAVLKRIRDGRLKARRRDGDSGPWLVRSEDFASMQAERLQPEAPKPEPDAPGPLSYSVRQAAELLGMSQWSIRYAIQRDGLPAKRLRRNPVDGRPTGRILILRTELEAWLRDLPDQHEPWWR